MEVNLDIKEIPKSCEECSFFKKESVKFGRYFSIKCLLTGVNTEAEGIGEQNDLKRKALKKCPLKKSTGIKEVEEENFLSKKFDELYEKAQNLMKKYNPCRIDENGLCLRSRNQEELFGYHKINNCCGNSKPSEYKGKSCKYLDENKGCTVKSLNCSIWFCDFIHTMFRKSDLLKEMEKIRKEAEEYNLAGDHRKPKEYTIKRAEISNKIDRLKKELKKMEKE